MVGDEFQAGALVVGLGPESLKLYVRQSLLAADPEAARAGARGVVCPAFRKGLACDSWRVAVARAGRAVVVIGELSRLRSVSTMIFVQSVGSVVTAACDVVSARATVPGCDTVGRLP